MNKKYAEYMTYGKTVKSSWTGNIFKLVENMDKTSDTVKAVALENERRYDVLEAWIRNWEKNYCNFRERFEGNIEDCKAERESYVEELKISNVNPNNTIRFITSNYATKFEVQDLSNILVNGKVSKVVYVDDYHFKFIEGFRTSGCFHICQFAELCERDGIVVQPILKN